MLHSAGHKYSSLLDSFSFRLAEEFNLSPVPSSSQQTSSSTAVQQVVSIPPNSASIPLIEQRFRLSPALSDRDNQRVKEALTNSGLLDLGSQIEKDIKEYGRMWTRANA
jgi:hypothetical protein